MISRNERAAIAAKHPGVIAGYRINDSYVFFGDDALTVARVCRPPESAHPCPLRWLASEPTFQAPYNAIEKYLTPLVRSGRRVALIDPQEAK